MFEFAASLAARRSLEQGQSRKRTQFRAKLPVCCAFELRASTASGANDGDAIVAQTGSMEKTKFSTIEADFKSLSLPNHIFGNLVCKFAHAGTPKLLYYPWFEIVIVYKVAGIVITVDMWPRIHSPFAESRSMPSDSGSLDS